jgi:protein ImuB
MWHWIALLPGPAPELELEPAGAPSALLQQLGWWALQFTPRVALLEDAVVLEVAASERLFGGPQALRDRVQTGAVVQLATRGVPKLGCAHAATARAALALARSSHAFAAPHGIATEADQQLQPKALSNLPLHSLTAVAVHASTLAQLGCRSLGDVRALPRSGLSRRFGAGILQAMDQAWGERPETFEWLQLPTTLDVQHELPCRTDTAAGLLPAFEQLMHALCAWLAGQQAGAEEVELRWCHEWANKGEARWQSWPMRLASPVTDVGLRVQRMVPWVAESDDLFAGGAGAALGATDGLVTPAAWRSQQEALLALVERFHVRLGPARVQQAQGWTDHRITHAQRWLPAMATLAQAPMRAPQSAPTVPWQATPASAHASATGHAVPQPCWLLPTPLPLAVDNRHAPREQPLYQGPLQLLAGPHRIEAGWWDEPAEANAVAEPNADPNVHTQARDHYLASSPRAGLLWVFRNRHAPADGSSPWFLQGFFG